MTFEAAQDRIIVCVSHSTAGIDHDICGWQAMLVKAKGFPDQALDQIATHRVPDSPCGNGQPESGDRVGVGAGQHGEE